MAYNQDDEFEEIEKYHQTSEMEKWYEDNFFYFNKRISFELGISLEIMLFYRNVYKPIMKELSEQIRALIYKQYPRVITDVRLRVREYVNWIVSDTGHKFLIYIFNLVQDQLQEIDLKQKYTNFERWKSTYANPPQPPQFDNSIFYQNPLFKGILTEEQLEKIAVDSWSKKKAIFDKKIKNKTEFYDILQPLLFKYFPVVQDFESDSWIVYAVEIHEEYEDFRFRCEHIDLFIKYEMDEEDIDLEYMDYQTKFSMKFNQIWNRDHPETL